MKFPSWFGASFVGKHSRCRSDAACPDPITCFLHFDPRLMQPTRDALSVPSRGIPKLRSIRPGRWTTSQSRSRPTTRTEEHSLRGSTFVTSRRRGRFCRYRPDAFVLTRFSARLLQCFENASRSWPRKFIKLHPSSVSHDHILPGSARDTAVDFRISTRGLEAKMPLVAGRPHPPIELRRE